MERIIDFSRIPGSKFETEPVLISNNRAVLTYLPEINRLALSSPFEDKEVAKQVPGASWKDKWKAWTYPLEYQTVLEVKRRFTNLVITDNVAKWVKRVEERRQQLMDLKHLQDIPIDVVNSDKLYPFQRVGVNYIKEIKRLILGDDMGLGKTFESQLGVESLECARVLTVVPKMVYGTWKRELTKWLPHRPFVLIQGSRKRKEKLLSEYGEGYLIISYESATNLKDKLKAMKWDAIIVDEAHNLRNHKALRTKAIKEISKNIPVKIPMTGTPIMNSSVKAARELFGILNFVYPERFTSFWRFIDQYYVYVDGEIKSLKDEKEFRAMLAPILLRRMKVDVLHDLPEKTYSKRYIQLYPAEKRVLKEMEQNMVARLSSGEEVAAPIVLAQITRMRQCCISARLLSKSVNEEHEEYKSAKLDALMEIVKESREAHKMVVFTQFKEALKLVKTMLQQANVPYLELSGDIKGKKREEAITRFQNENIPIMLCTIQAAGVGVDGLQVADIAIFLDRHWTPGINLQAEDRLLRMGQRKNVTIIMLIAEGTVEERVEAILEEKQATFDDWIEGTAKVTTNELRRLF